MIEKEDKDNVNEKEKKKLIIFCKPYFTKKRS
jgi:hypothetical protein